MFVRANEDSQRLQSALTENLDFPLVMDGNAEV
jgi:hypothetical protein